MKKEPGILACILMLLTASAVVAQKPTVTPEPARLLRAAELAPVSHGQAATASPTSTASSTPACPANPADPKLTTPLREGASQLSGIGSTFDSSCTMQINVYDVSAGTAQLLATSASAGQTSDGSKGTFAVTLAEPLRGGQKIAVREVFTSSTGGTPATAPSTDDALVASGIDVIVPGDWGRVKAYFTSGILISQNQQSFSQSSLFMGFTIDKSWMLPGYYHASKNEKENQKGQKKQSQSGLAGNVDDVKMAYRGGRGGPSEAADAEEGLADGQGTLTPTPQATAIRQATPTSQSTSTASPTPTPTPTPSPAPTPSPSPTPTQRHGKGPWWRPGVNTFFEVRLTQIPVTSCATTATTTTNTASPCATPSPSPSPSPSPAPTNLETFLSSQKSARLGVGIYFPFTWTTWTYNKTPNALFFAPLAKVGFDTPTGALNQAQPAANAGTGATSGTGTVTAVNQSNFYNFYSFGARIGHYALTSSSDQAPELVSYLDVAFGPYSNLETLVLPLGAAAGTTPGTKRLYRVNVEGILKVPTTPLIIGLSANVGQESVGLGGFRIVQRAGDDLRFLFGVKFDVAKLLAKVTERAP